MKAWTGKTKPATVAWTAVFFMIAVGFITISLAGAQDTAKYMGADKCKNCHNAKEKGDQYNLWKAEDHAKAYANLAGDKAKEAGKAAGVDEPQKSDKCLKCHTTAFAAKDKRDAKFDETQGVQCEACHGPGEAHVKARLAAAADADDGDDLFGGGAAGPTEIPAGEINGKPDAKVCQGCHNKESPTFKDFNFDEMSKKIAHPDPRKK